MPDDPAAPRTRGRGTTHLLVLALAVLAAAVTAPAAGAKGIKRVTACGSDGCVDVTARADGEALLEMGFAAGGPTTRGPGFVRLTVVVGDDTAEERIAQLYVPARNLAATRDDAGDWQWWKPDPAVATALRRAVAGVRPWAATRLPRAAIRTVPPAPPQARVAETFAPAVSRSGAGDGGMPTWAWLALVAGVALLAGGGRAALRSPRRRR